MPENLPRAVEEEHPARYVENGENHEQHDIEKPQGAGDGIGARNWERELVQCQCQCAGPHRHGKPIRCELTDDVGQPNPRGPFGCHLQFHSAYLGHRSWALQHPHLAFDAAIGAQPQ
jgi:hypothetical protein